jgi:predicted metal-binding membrane protein
MMSMRRADARRVAAADVLTAGHDARTELPGRVLAGVAALVFLAAVGVTVVQCTAMSAMGGTDMPGGWRLSMAWMRMPGSGWLATCASFLGMWLAMMTAMMLPSLLPVLQGYRARAGGPGSVLLAALGYLTVSSALGIAIFAGGAALASLALQRSLLAQAAPLAAGLVIVAAGCVQLTHWKARHLACCREAAGGAGVFAASALGAWRRGARLGLHCSCCCSPHTAVLLVAGIMDIRAMAAVAAVITAERLLSAGAGLARVTGGIALGVGLLLTAHAAGLA